jgi:uncharacterized cupin superfamily protein
MTQPSTPSPKSCLLRAAERERLPQQSQSHPLNPASLVSGVSLSEATGLQSVGLHLLRIAPGKESFVYHSHQTEEEFLFILSGRGIAEVGDEEYEVGPGDFLGFRAPSVAHHLRNPFDEELVYLSGGERREVEVADFPRLGKRMVRVGGQLAMHDLANEQPLVSENT